MKKSMSMGKKNRIVSITYRNSLTTLGEEEEGRRQEEQ